MINQKEIKKRIQSMNSLIKTTEAMKMISVVKLRKLKEKKIHINMYYDEITKIFNNLIITTCKHSNLNFLKNTKYFLFDHNKKNKKTLFIILTSDRGLCGSFNYSIFNKINTIINNTKYYKEKYLFFSIGKKGIDFLLKKKYNLYHHTQLYSNNCNKKNVLYLIQQIIKDFLNDKINYIYIVYNTLQKNSFHKTNYELFLPIIYSDFLKIKEKHFIYNNDFILECSTKEFFNYIIQTFLKIKLLKTILESYTAEHTSRMISMHKATENAYKIKEDLILNYNKERQTAITKEILEIISGIDSLQ
ncbi:ATP synthase F1 subunit gamma [Blattabacterium cuenoti]|uniref:ATP synthase F1 subunit gamma n=1 Tax=Blattabacterium cuenoti TaxID=1653831 RepID=UPI00163D2210|nr:ATP synthase F1 subunit gamma [Blattabacterium cuenoti]